MAHSKENFSGSSALEGKNGMFAMKLMERNLKNFTPDFVARKSVFCFDNRMICLGTGISNSNASFPTETTLFQSTFQKGKTDIHVDGKLRNEAFHQTLDDKNAIIFRTDIIIIILSTATTCRYKLLTKYRDTKKPH